MENIPSVVALAGLPEETHVATKNGTMTKLIIIAVKPSTNNFHDGCIIPAFIPSGMNIAERMRRFNENDINLLMALMLNNPRSAI